MSEYKGLSTFDEDNHRYVPIAQADGIIDTMDYVPDSEPVEPLIKDKRIRKAVRAWAEANGIKEIIIFDHCNNAPYTPVGAVEFAGNASRLKILFRTEEQFDTNRIYTIEELCGEEEE